MTPRTVIHLAKTASVLTVVPIVLAVAGCAQYGSQPSSEIAALSDQWEAALNAGDVEAIAALYTEDCRLMAPGAEMGVGRDAVRAGFGAMIDAGLSGDLESIETVESGDIGYNVGTFTLKSPTGEIVDRGKFIEVWRKDGGSWKLANDIFNSDMPPGPAGMTVTITHDVKDAEHWLAAWQGPDGRREQFASYGVADVRVFQNPENPNRVGLIVDVTDMDAFQTWLATDEGRAAAAEDGVIWKTMQMFAEVK